MKICRKEKVEEDILKSLDSININETSLFADISTISKSIKEKYGKKEG